MTPLPSVPQQLVEAVTQRPADTLLTFLDTGQDFSNADVLQEALRWSAALQQLGVRPGETVVAMLPPCPAAVFEWLGTAWLGALEVPLNTEYRGNMLAQVVNNARARVAVVSAQYLGRFADIAEKLEHLKVIVVADADEGTASGLEIVHGPKLLAGTPPATGLTTPRREDVAAVIYTSGTTGASKGVVMPWGVLPTHSASFGPVTGRGFRFYSTWAMFHCAGKAGVTDAISRGGTLILRQRWRTDQFWSDVRASGATSTGFLGGISNFIWSQPERPDDADNPLEHVLMAPVIPQYLAFERRFGLKIHTGFASSEAGMPTSCPSPVPNHRTCGRLVPGYQIRLVDAQGNEVGPNTVGEALVRAEDRDTMFRGYLNMPEKTAEAWEGGWFHSGDGLVRDEDGNYYFVDRVKDSIRRRGENISSFEVENEVNAHPEVLESAAVEAKGEDGDGEVMVFVVRHPGADLQPQALVEFLVPRMPRFMVPRFVEFVDALPKTHTNRTRKIELRNRGVGASTWDRVAAGFVLAR
ncbi:MAG TPA: AMP-binding protein [Ramlibacter sp.]|nr:AMP-binding protein [Ramlibacter sp.]